MIESILIALFGSFLFASCIEKRTLLKPSFSILSNKVRLKVCHFFFQYFIFQQPTKKVFVSKSKPQLHS